MNGTRVIIQGIEMKRYIQTQKYFDCKLIAVLNARTYLTGKYIDPASKEYEELVDLVKARHGAAFISEIKKLLEQFGMDYKGGPIDFRWIHGNLPVEVCIWHPKLGHHCVCITGAEYDPSQKLISVANFLDREGQLTSWNMFSKMIVRDRPNLGFGLDAISYYMKGG